VPKRKQKTTIWRTSPRAMESKMEVGKVCSRMAANDRVVVGRLGSTAALSSAMPTPGRTRLTAPRPRKRAMVVTISK